MNSTMSSKLTLLLYSHLVTVTGSQAYFYVGTLKCGKMFCQTANNIRNNKYLAQFCLIYLGSPILTCDFVQ